MLPARGGLLCRRADFATVANCRLGADKHLVFPGDPNHCDRCQTDERHIENVRPAHLVVPAGFDDGLNITHKTPKAALCDVVGHKAKEHPDEEAEEHAEGDGVYALVSHCVAFFALSSVAALRFFSAGHSLATVSIPGLLVSLLLIFLSV